MLCFSGEEEEEEMKTTLHIPKNVLKLLKHVAAVLVADH
jgi:hypothetical protein